MGQTYGHGPIQGLITTSITGNVPLYTLTSSHKTHQGTLQIVPHSDITPALLKGQLNQFWGHLLTSKAACGIWGSMVNSGQVTEGCISKSLVASITRCHVE